MRFKTLTAMLLLALVCVLPAQAATTLTETYLSSAITSTQNTVTVASATGFTVGYIMFVDREAMVVQAINSTIMTVQRGTNGTAPAAHRSGAGVLVQTPSAFFQTDVSGTCNTITERYLPHVNVVNGSIYDCAITSATATAGAGVWVRYRDYGFAAPNLIGYSSVTALTVGAALPVRGGIISVAGGSAQAYTLAVPARYQNGMVMIIVCGSAQAHTVTVAGGINGGSTASDVATFAAIGDSLTLVALDGVWYLVAFRGTSIG